MKNGLVDFTEFLNESQSKTIQALADKFGKLTVYCRSQEFVSDIPSMKGVYEILNMTLFERKLDSSSIDFQSKSFEALNAYRMSLHPDFESLKNNFFSVFSGLCDFKVCKEYVDDLKPYRAIMTKDLYKSIEVRLRFPGIYVNLDKMKHANFIFFANSMCHEMIHQYDHTFGEIDDLWKQESLFEEVQSINSHSTMTFKAMKEKARKEHLKVIDQVDGEIDYQKLNDEAYNFMIAEGLPCDREIKLFRNEKDELLVDMTQFKDTPSATTVSKQYRSIHLYD